jgi:DNA-binding MarR family transcriptional regulator
VAKRSVLRTENLKDEPDAGQSVTLSSIANASAKAAETTELDRLIHERTRLAIISALAVNEAMTFNDLKALLNTTDGNLSVHARKLEEAEYIVCTKSFEGRIPKTEYQVTPAGRKALERYLNHMEALIQATRRK